MNREKYVKLNDVLYAIDESRCIGCSNDVTLGCAVCQFDDVYVNVLGIPTKDVIPKEFLTRKEDEAYERGYLEALEELEERIAIHAFTSKSEDYADGAYDTVAWVDSKIDGLRQKYSEELK